ncbi:MAG: penicillin-binding protein 1C, partial [Pseudomonadota bacterium]
MPDRPARFIRHRHMAGRVSALLSAGLVGVVMTVLALDIAIRHTPLPSTERASMESRLVLDREGRVLWGALAQDGRWRLTTRPSDLSADHLAMILAYEDKRFHHHLGVDPLAVVR